MGYTCSSSLWLSTPGSVPAEGVLPEPPTELCWTTTPSVELAWLPARLAPAPDAPVAPVAPPSCPHLDGFLGDLAVRGLHGDREDRGALLLGVAGVLSLSEVSSVSSLALAATELRVLRPLCGLPRLSAALSLRACASIRPSCSFDMNGTAQNLAAFRFCILQHVGQYLARGTRVASEHVSTGSRHTPARRRLIMMRIETRRGPACAGANPVDQITRYIFPPPRIKCPNSQCLCGGVPFARSGGTAALLVSASVPPPPVSKLKAVGLEHVHAAEPWSSHVQSSARMPNEKAASMPGLRDEAVKNKRTAPAVPASRSLPPGRLPPTAGLVAACRPR